METTNLRQKDIAIEVKSFSKKYFNRSNFAVKDASFVVKKGSFHGFIGANGAGKTTTIKSLIGAYSNTNFKGEIYFFGLKNGSVNAKKKVGYIPESANFPKRMNLFKYLVYMSNLSGLSWNKAKKFANKVIKDLGLEKVKRKSPLSFSSGQKKKVLLAQALVHDPEILIMDEPAANLDPKARMDFFDQLLKLKKEGKTIFLSSHILSELNSYVDSVTILDGGKVVFSDEVSKINNQNSYQYSVCLRKTQDFDLVKKWVKDNSLKHSKTENKKELIIQLERKEILQKFTQFVSKNKIDYLWIQSKQTSLQDLYKGFVQKGSLDTLDNQGGKNA